VNDTGTRRPLPPDWGGLLWPCRRQETPLWPVWPI